MSRCSASSRAIALLTVLAGCSLVSPGKETLSSGECAKGEKVCGADCVSTASPNVGCGSAKCEPCALPHAAAECAGGKCAVAVCELGYGDCNGTVEDGCETSLHDDPQHCGACGEPCKIPRATSSCISGQCVAVGCAPGYGECDGDPITICETDLGQDANHCGACEKACSLAGAATLACTKGTCAISECTPGRANCNVVASDGCETDVTTDPASCGSCGHACTAEQLCEAGQCVKRCPAIHAVHAEARLSVGASGFGVGAGDFTVEAWLSISDYAQGRVAIVTMNEQYAVSGISITARKQAVACTVLDPMGASPKFGTADVEGPALLPNHWAHLACVRTGATLTMFIDGKVVNAGPIGTDLVELSPFAIGVGVGYAGTLDNGTALLTLGPIRFSKTARYTAPFVPSTDWPIDADTVAQFLTKQGFEANASSALLDEAGGDNKVTNFGGFVPALAGVACKD